MSKIIHSVVVKPLEDLYSPRVRMEAGNDKSNWIDVYTGATLLKGVSYLVKIEIQEEVNENP